MKDHKSPVKPEKGTHMMAGNNEMTQLANDADRMLAPLEQTRVEEGALTNYGFICHMEKYRGPALKSVKNE